MNKKTLILSALLTIFLASCNLQKGGKEIPKTKIAEQIQAEIGNAVKDFKLDVEQLNDSTFQGIHTFHNPIFDKDVRVTNNYTFSSDKEHINRKELVSTEYKEDGKWIKPGN